MGDAVGEGHQHGGEERGDGFAVVVPVDFGDGRHHNHADDDQHSAGGSRWDGQKNGAEEQREDKADDHHKGGQSGASAFGHAGSAFNVSGGGAGTQARAHGGGDGIGHENAAKPIHTPLLVHHIGPHRHADNGAKGVEHVEEKEGEHHHEHIPGEDVRPLELAENGRYGGGHRHRMVDVGGPEEDADDGSGQHTEQDAAFHLQNHEDGGDGHSDDEEEHRAVFGFAEGDERGGVVNDDAGILQPDERDEESDARSDGVFQRGGNGIHNGLPDVGDGEDDEENALQQDGGEGKLPRIAHGEAYGEDKEGVQSHAGRESEGLLGVNRHDEGAHNGRQRGGGEHRVGGHPLLVQSTENAGVDGQNIGHREESGDTRHYFRLNTMFLGVKPK